MLAVLYAVKIVYICVFMTCSTSCCHCDTIIAPWNVCVHLYIYVYVYVEPPRGTRGRREDWKDEVKWWAL